MTAINNNVQTGGNAPTFISDISPCRNKSPNDMKPFDQDTNNNRYLTKKEVASLFQMTIRTIDAWMARGLVPYLKIGGKTVRFKRADVEAYVEEHFRVARRSTGRNP